MNSRIEKRREKGGDYNTVGVNVWRGIHCLIWQMGPGFIYFTHSDLIPWMNPTGVSLTSMVVDASPTLLLQVECHPA